MIIIMIRMMIDDDHHIDDAVADEAAVCQRRVSQHPDWKSKAATSERSNFRIIWQSTQDYSEVSNEVRLVAVSETSKEESPLLVTIQPTVLVVENPPSYISILEEKIGARQPLSQR